jgi:transcriptional regulator with XRE-family HTH domain
MQIVQLKINNDICEQLESCDYGFTKVNFSLYLSRVLKKNSLSATRFAAAIGSVHASVNNWLNQVNLPSIEPISATARLLGVSDAEVFTQICYRLEPPLIPKTPLAMALEALLEVGEDEMAEAIDAYRRLPLGSGMKLVQLISRLENS